MPSNPFGTELYDQSYDSKTIGFEEFSAGIRKLRLSKIPQYKLGLGEK
jgi:hypothetical protein